MTGMRRMAIFALALFLAAYPAPTSALSNGLPPIYPANPGAITVLINPGHGGRFIGAVGSGLREKNVNLDIGLRLRQLLLEAGVNVVMTRTTDTAVNKPRIDVNGDGLIGATPDELEARVDIGNLARADVHIFNHFNGARCHCVRGTKTYTGGKRVFTPENLAFASLIQSELIHELDHFRSATYYPIDRGVKTRGFYYTLSPYDRPIWPRPSLMPTVMTETLYISDPVEAALLQRDDVRQAIAEGIYRGIADFLGARDYGIRYELLDAPTDVPAGGTSDYQVEVTNTGNLPSAGWQLQLHSVPAVPRYDGSDAVGHFSGSADIPDGLAPGATTQVTVHATAPSTPGRWLVKADVSIGGASRPFLSQRGVVALQVPLTTHP
jgi:N-acetylmuramoyl-L-alanine amidase